MSASTNAMCVWDFTASAEMNTKEGIEKVLGQQCKKWCFQKERSESGYVHFQGRFSLRVKKRQTGVIKIFGGWHISLTSMLNKDNMFYVMKEETRIDGPWCSDDPKMYIPRQCRVKEWMPFQRQIMENIVVHPDNFDTRRIHVLVDFGGCTGKSTLAYYVGASRKLGCMIPPMNDFRDIMRVVMNKPKLGAYIIDMPRAMNKEKLYSLYSGIETIKSGYAYDDRYNFKDEFFDSPHVWVFTNKVPDMSLLSPDRWCVWRINKSHWGLEEFPIVKDEAFFEK